MSRPSENRVAGGGQHLCVDCSVIRDYSERLFPERRYRSGSRYRRRAARRVLSDHGRTHQKCGDHYSKRSQRRKRDISSNQRQHRQVVYRIEATQRAQAYGRGAGTTAPQSEWRARPVRFFIACPKPATGRQAKQKPLSICAAKRAGGRTDRLVGTITDEDARGTDLSRCGQRFAIKRFASSCGYQS